MHDSDYFRERAAAFRREAEDARDAAEKMELLDCALVCDEVANRMDELRASG